jgi:hypothetical protein
VRLLLFHPGPARIDCAECKRFIFDHKTGDQKTYKAGASGEEKPCVRPQNVPTPCHECPKESPQKCKEHELSRKNRMTLRLYYEVRATSGQCLTPAMRGDRLLMRNLAIVDGIYRQFEQDQMARSIVAGIAILKR